MGDAKRNVLRWVVAALAVVLFAAACLVLISRLLGSTESRPNDGLEASFKPLLTYDGKLYLFENDRVPLASESELIGTVQTNLGTLTESPDPTAGDFISNVFDVGSNVYESGGHLFVELPDGIIELAADHG